TTSGAARRFRGRSSRRTGRARWRSDPACTSVASGRRAGGGSSPTGATDRAAARTGAGSTVGPAAGAGPRRSAVRGTSGRRAGPPAALAVLGGLLTVLVTVPERLVPGLGTYARPLLIGLAWLAFAAAIPLARRIPARVAVPVILAGAVAMPVAAAVGPPGGSDDVYRYVWDGRVQAAGINPYRYPPASTELVFLRDPGLWPAHETAWCVTSDDPSSDERLVPGCTLINRPAVPTIYPPVAQAYFFVVHVLSPAGALARPFQLAGAVVAIATTLLLLFAA